jgi:hypothetical protein
MGEAKRRVEKKDATTEGLVRDEIVVVATVEVIKRVWSNGGGTIGTLAHVITNDEHWFIVSARGGEAMNALLALNPGDTARFTGRCSSPFEAVPIIELSQVALIDRSGWVEAWREEWLFISTDQLPQDFRRRVASRRTTNCRCVSCGTTIETADQIALMILRDYRARWVCVDCGALPRDELGEKLGVELSPTQSVALAVRAECAIALSCGLDPHDAVGCSADGEWDWDWMAHRDRSTNGA